MRLSMRYMLAVALLNIGAGGLLEAQTVPGRYHPTPAECRQAAKILVDRASKDWRWQILPMCGRWGGDKLAQALRNARSETDPAYLERLYGLMVSIRDPDIFREALATLQDESATPGARSTAVLIAVAQHDNRVGLPLNLSLADALRSGQCRLLPTMYGRYYSTSSLPVTYLSQLGNALLELRAAPGTPDLVNSFVNCTRSVMLGVIADAVPTSAIRLTYVCGNRYRVENQSTESVQVSWGVSGIRTKAAIVVPPKGANTFTAQQQGPTTLYYRGRFVQTEPNLGRPCQ